MVREFTGPATPLTTADILAAATAKGLTAPLVEAVRAVESSGSGFLDDGRPKILCEAQKFHGYTDGRFDKTHPHISSPVWNRALYAGSGEGEYLRLGEMLALDRAAALLSTSWGAFQILGANFHAAGFGAVEDFVAAMCTTEAAHLAAFLAFITSEGLLAALRQKQWDAFARGYNGPRYAENSYGAKLRAAYAKALASEPTTTAVVEALPPN